MRLPFIYTILCMILLSSLFHNILAIYPSRFRMNSITTFRFCIEDLLSYVLFSTSVRRLCSSTSW